MFGLTRSTYYYHAHNIDKENKDNATKNENEDKYDSLKKEIVRIFEENKKRYGYRRITAVLRQKGHNINHKTVFKLMKAMDLQGKKRKGKYKSYKGEVGETAPNLLNRDFTADEPYTKLVTDVTEFMVCGTRVYLSPVMDLCNREILSYDISYSANFQQIRNMLNKLFAVLPEGEKPMLHSDQGWQYQIKPFQQMLKEHNITQSMSRKGNCLDNGCMENFFGRLKVEMFYGETFESPEEFIQKLEEYIDYHNHRRISLKFGGLSPVQYRTQHQANSN